MSRKRRIELNWDALDWRKSGAVLARENGLSPNTIHRARKRLKKPSPETRLTQKDKDNATRARKEALKNGRYDECYRKKRIKQKGIPHGNDAKISASHLRHGEDHPNAEFHQLISPAGETYKFRNLAEWIRNNSDLFTDEELLLRKKPSGKTYSRAANGLLSVSNGSKKSWKGWVQG